MHTLKPYQFRTFPDSTRDNPKHVFTHGIVLFKADSFHTEFRLNPQFRVLTIFTYSNLQLIFNESSSMFFLVNVKFAKVIKFISSLRLVYVKRCFIYFKQS